MVAALSFGLSCLPAHAQLLDRYLPDQVVAHDEVRARPLSDYANPGIRMGDIILHLNLEESTGYDSNVFARSHGTGSARIETIAAMQANTDWSRGSLGVFFALDDVRTPQASVLSHTDTTASIASSLDIGQGQVRVAYSHLNLNLLPTDVGVLNVQQATPFVVNDLRLSYTVPLGSLTIMPEFILDTFRFGVGEGSGLNSAAPQGFTFLDRNIFISGITARHEVAPQQDLVLVLRDTTATFLSARPGQPRRNYNDASVLAGIDFTASGVFRYRALVGFETRNYASRRIAGASAPIAEASVTWTPTQLTTLTATVTRRIEDALEDNIADYTYSELRLDAYHELRRNVLLHGYAGVQRAEYAQSSGAQTLYTVGASARVLLNRNMELKASANWSDSNAPSPNTYKREVYLLQLRFGL